MKNVNINKQPLTFMDALCLVFIVLKLCGVINWSWVWVLAPEWVCVLPLIIYVVSGAYDHDRIRNALGWSAKGRR